MFWRSLARTGLVGAVSLLAAVQLAAQLTEATLTGVVTDSTGKLVSSSSVEVRNEQTGQTRKGITDNRGAFAMPELPPGAYTVSVTAPGFKVFEQKGLELKVGQTTELNAQLEVGGANEVVVVQADQARVAVASDARLADTIAQEQLTDLPVTQRDVTGLTRLSAGATAIPGNASSTKLSNSPVVTVNGNRYRGNNFVLDGSMDTNPNNTGEPAIVPTLESVEEVQVQTGNFSAEFGRGNGSVVNLRTKSGTNEFHGKAWEYIRNTDVNARNYFATRGTPLVFNQFGGILGGPIFKDKTFFFVSYEGTRNASGQALQFQVETPEFSNYVVTNAPSSVAAGLLKSHPAPRPLPGTNGQKYAGEVDFTPSGSSTPIPELATAAVILGDYSTADQYLGRVDHSFHGGKDKVIGRWISENEYDNGGYSSQPATLGEAARGYLGPFNGFFGDANLGHVHVFDHLVNDARFSFLALDTEVGNPKAVVPQITIVGIQAPFGDIFLNGTRLRTYEWRDTVSIQHGRQLIRTGGEFRKIFKGISLAPPTAGSFFFRTATDFAGDKPFSQTLTVNPYTGEPAGFPRYFTVYESGLFVQDDWKISSRFTLNLGLRHDYFGDASEKHGLLSSFIPGTGSTFDERLATGAVGRVKRLYTPQKLNFSPRVGFAYDPFGDGKSSIRAGFSLAFQPHHGQSIAGARALPPDAIQGVLSPAQGIGTQINYGIPVPYNPQFARGLNAQGGVPGLQITGFVVNPTIKTQYSESWFLNVEHEFPRNWVIEVGYVGTTGVNLERLDDVNRMKGDLISNPNQIGKLHRINPNFGTLTWVTNGVSSSYNAGTVEVRHNVGQLSLQANYRFSKWLDTDSDTQPGQFTDSSEPAKGAEDFNCLHCERGHSMFDIPQRFTASVLWAPNPVKQRSLLAAVADHWELSTITAVQSGRPFSVWNGAPSNLQCNNNGTLTPAPSAGCTSGTLMNTGGDYNLDGGGAIFSGYYDRPNAPKPGTVSSSFSHKRFLTGLFDPNAFPTPSLGQDGTLGRFTYRGPHQINSDVSLARSFSLLDRTRMQLRLDAFNILNYVNLYLPNSDLSLALNSKTGTYSTTSSFGKSIRAFDPRTLQASVKFAF
ncbi:TonB-dependent receptor [Occallatibacter riparius]|uniref:TonB-dependent receptor n=1 Tax=Occallatibacter riparius TaxID=1002689 RepID=A0A9J7BPB2_9BACT|nr:TonB-dependent receptor [Occallatibacter riparius]UWZ84369.1 TonB-dependent receptor [Occallatibacter riparius]